MSDFIPELNEDQVERIDSVYAHTCHVCSVIANDDALEEDICFTGPIAEHAAMCLVNAGYSVYFPFEATDDRDDDTVIEDFYTPENTDTDGWVLTAKKKRTSELSEAQKARVKEVDDSIVKFCRFMTVKKDLVVDASIIDLIADPYGLSGFPIKIKEEKL